MSTLVICDDGEYECCNQNGHPSNAGEECTCCGERFQEDEMTFVGRYSDDRVCDRCLSREYRLVHGYRRREYYIHEDHAIYVDSQDGYYDYDHLDDNDIVQLYDGDYEHTDNCVLVDGDYYLDDDRRVVQLHDGEYALRDDCVELHDGDYALTDDAWQCAESNEWYLTDEDTPVVIDGKNYHENSDAAQAHAEAEESDE